MNIFKIIRTELETVLSSIESEKRYNFDTKNITVEPPRDEKHGCMSTNSAMVLSRQAGINPRDLAEMIVEKLQKSDFVASAEIAGPGFINIRLNKNIWFDVLSSILSQPKKYGDSEIGKGEKINIEYVSANPTGPLHIGHARGAVVGDVLASLLQKCGYDIMREYYINDSGVQVDVLAKSAFLRYLEALGEKIEIPEGLYPGEYLIDVGVALKEKYGDELRAKNEADYLPVVKDFTINAMMTTIKDDLALLGVKHDIFTSEKKLVESGAVEKTIDNLKQNGFVYEGVLTPPKGQLPDDWEQREQTLFKSTKFGDDIDRPLKKSDGSNTYFASDIAYHLDKYNRGGVKQIDVLGADHGGYVKRMKGALNAVTNGKGTLDVQLCQLVKLMDNGEVLKMSKRAGTFVTLKDLIKDVGSDVVRFFMMMRKTDAPLDFDLTKVKEQSKDNPIFYIQYAHARCCSVLRSAQESNIDYNDANLKLLDNADFISVIKELSQYPRILESSAINMEPHRVAFYLVSLAGAFHELWSKGSGDEKLRFIQENKIDETKACLALVYCVKEVIANGLAIFSIQAKNKL
ncbi:MAG: arginine--tRNA ligase [Alphaproteobacteria bacterium]|nr:arginine--tRNA ligase [Alphaproteobacteria bacterium]